MLRAKQTPLEKEIYWVGNFIDNYFATTDKSPQYFTFLKDILSDVVKLVNGRTPITGIKRESIEIKIFLAQNARHLFKGKNISNIDNEMLLQVKAFLNEQ